MTTQGQAMRKPIQKPTKQPKPYGAMTTDSNRSTNKVILLGRLGADPNLISFPSGMFLVTLSIATNIKYTDKATKQKITHTEWHKVIIYDMAWGEVLFKELHKGQQIYLEGKLRHTQNSKYPTHIEPTQIKTI